MDNQAYNHSDRQMDPQPIQQSTSNVTVGTTGKFRDWTIPAILAIFCFAPTGMWAVYHANYARLLFYAGDIVEARTNMAWARGLTFVSIGFGITLISFIIAVPYLV
eukprot:XP_011448429.1 PREDICTED: uncharacterized protein LOC105342988 [Crassostrea gigas]